MYVNSPTFGTFSIQVDAPFETIRSCGFEWWNNCVQCWFPKWFWMVGQLIQNLVWIFQNGSTANTRPCLDTSKWCINGPSKTILNSLLPTLFKWYHHVCTKPMGIFESGNFEWFQIMPFIGEIIIVYTCTRSVSKCVHFRKLNGKCQA